MTDAIAAAYQRAVARRSGTGGGGGGRASTTSPLRYSSVRAGSALGEPTFDQLQALFEQLPFAATRAGAELHPVRAVLSDALRDKGREAEADLAGDPSKKLRPVYHDHASGWSLEEQPHVGEDEATTSHLPSNVRQYLDTALWSSTDDDEMPLDALTTVHSFSKDAMERAHHDVHRFYSTLSPRALEAAYSDEDQAAHDLWLTRQGHGSGFFDGDWDHHGEDVAEELTAAAKRLGEQHVEVEHHGDADPDRNGEYTLHLHGGR